MNLRHHRLASLCLTLIGKIVFPTGANEQWADLNMFNELMYCKGVILPYLLGFTGATDYSMTNKYDNCDTNIIMTNYILYIYRSWCPRGISWFTTFHNPHELDIDHGILGHAILAGSLSR